MKLCAYCGRENVDEATHCFECGTEKFKGDDNTKPESQKKKPEFQFGALSATEMQKDWVTLVTCRTLLDADMIATRLDIAGIETFIPDATLMQTMSWPYSFGYVRVQVSPRNYDEAKNFLSEPDQNA